MLRVTGIILLLLAVPCLVLAEDAPKAQVFGGYQYFRLDTGISGVDKFNLNGWNAAFDGYFHKYFGVTADFSGAYGSGIGIHTKVHTFMFGPVVRMTNPTRITPFVHFLGGGAHVSGSAFGSSASDTGARGRLAADWMPILRHALASG